MRRWTSAFITSLILFGCGPTVYYVKPPDWRTLEKRDSTIQFYSQYVKGWKFYVDPGHGGEDRFSHGPAYDVIEADVNLRVALSLADNLRRAGAVIYMSRTKDTTVTLGDRPRLSNASGADMFISVHHNAVGSSQDRYTNFTSVWYHARETDSVFHPSNQDLARYVQRDLAYAMGNPGSLSSFDGTMSDYTVYPNAGFAVLRLAQIPAVLIEGSFFTSEYEEQRLKREEFNEIEAWGAFKGIGRYFRAGFPKLRLLSDTVSEGYRPTVIVQADDSSGIDWKSLQVKVDGIEVEASVIPDSNIIFYTPNLDLSNGPHALDVIVRNKNGNASWPFRKTVLVKPPVDSITISAVPQELPPSPVVFSRISLHSFDRKGDRSADGTVIFLSSTSGFVPPSVTILGGDAEVFFTPDTAERPVVVTASSSGKSAQITLNVVHSRTKYVVGKVASSSDSIPINGATVVAHREVPLPFILPLTTETAADGRYILPNDGADTLLLEIAASGFFGLTESLPVKEEVTPFARYLTPIARGVLRGRTFVLDARYGGAETGPTVAQNGLLLRTSDVNLEITKRLQRLLSAAGAKAYLVRKHDITLAEGMRAKYASSIRGNLYIGINAGAPEGRIDVFTDPTVGRGTLGTSLLRGISATLHRDTLPAHFDRTPMFNSVPYGALDITLPAITDTLFRSPLPYAAQMCAWGVFRGLLIAYGFSEDSSSTLLLPPASFPPFMRVLLDNSLFSVSAGDGSCIFYGITGSTGRTRIMEE